MLAVVGALVEAGYPLVLAESMKMEITVPAAAAARETVLSVVVKPGRTVRARDIVMALEEK